MSYKEEKLQEGLKNYENWALREIYKTQFHGIKRMVYNFHNKLIDPEDIFQEGLSDLIHGMHVGKINIKKSVAAYFYGLCRKICLNKLNYYNKNPISAKQPVENENDICDDNYYEKLNFIIRIKSQLSIKCREIIDLRFKLNTNEIDDKYSKIKLTGHDEIAEKLELTTTNARKIFQRCFDRLREMLYDDPEFKYLFDKP